MIRIGLNLSTLSILIAGLYCTTHETNAMAVSESIWLEIAEKLEEFLPIWDYSRLSFEDWVDHNLMILPIVLFTNEELEELYKESLCWTRWNGNVELLISMDMSHIGDE